MYSRMDQVKFIKAVFIKFEMKKGLGVYKKSICGKLGINWRETIYKYICKFYCNKVNVAFM